MKKLSVLLFVLSFLSLKDSYAQTLSFRSTFFGYNYYIDGRLAPHDYFAEVISEDPMAGKMYNSYAKNRGLSQVLGGVGGFLIGSPLGQSLRGNLNPNWKLAIIGSGLVVVSVILNAQYKNKTKEALDVYHSNKAIGNVPIKINLGVTENGVGFQMSF